MSVWFEGSNEIECDIRDVREALEDPGTFLAGVVGRMPGITNVELVDQGADFVTIKTNEGVMKRTNIFKRFDAGGVAVELDEEYQAGSKITTTGHFSEQYTVGDGVTHRLVISDVSAPGFLGFFYRKFGSARTGNAFLKASKDHLE
ncbi:MAG: hypothetical protein KJN71_03475 [Acidimicrobiia bacterium]|nr:hypothetical protein [Acidimicrobiia bacterium]